MSFTAADLQLLQRTMRVGLPPRLGPSTNPSNLLQQIKPFLERQENLLKTGKGDLTRQIKDALAKGQDLTLVIRGLMDRGEKIGDIMQAAAAAGVTDYVQLANAAMAAGANLQDVRAALASLGYPGADTYAYTPPAPPAGPFTTFSGTSLGGGKGGVASPSF